MTTTRDAKTPVLRQGDVLLIPVAAIPDGLQDTRSDAKGRIILAYGEVSGHAHALDAKAVRGFHLRSSLADEPDYILVGPDGAQLNHETDDGGPADHQPIKLAAGAYKVARQREYSEEETRRAMD